MATADLLVVGLGNPEAEFAGTRHNVGADAVRLVAERHSVTLRSERGLHARIGTARTASRTLVLAVPTTYMNDSGIAVRALVKRYLSLGPGGFEPGALAIVQDELDLAPGVVRVKIGGGTAGHNGLRSIQSHLRHLDFVRVRIGVGKPPGRAAGASHVLKRPSKAERDLLDVAVHVAADAVEVLFEEGPEAAMNRFNTKA